MDTSSGKENKVIIKDEEKVAVSAPDMGVKAFNVAQQTHSDFKNFKKAHHSSHSFLDIYVKDARIWAFIAILISVVSLAINMLQFIL